MSVKSTKDEELMSIKLDKPGRVKSQEQLARHTIDSQFEDKPIDRSVYLLTKGDDAQKLSIVQNLQQLYQFEPSATISRILPKIQQELTSSSSEFNIATAKIFQSLIQNKVPLNLLGSILQGIDSRDPIVATTWIETLLESINYLPEAQIKGEVLKWAVHRSAPNRPTLYRVASCHLLGRCAVHPKVQSVEVKTTILPLVHGLAQDVSYEVRACMAAQLANVAQGLKDPNAIKTALLPSVVELAKDTNAIVRSAAIVSIAQLLTNLSRDTKQEVIVPLFKDLCNYSIEDGEGTYPVLAREYGKYLIGLQDVLNPSDCLWLLKCFKILSTKGLSSIVSNTTDPTQGVYCRHYCAQNLPPITSFTITKIGGSMDVWYSVFRDLAADPCYIVRKSVAACLHEVVVILGFQCRMIKPDIVRLLRDDAEDVLHMVVPNLGITMEILANYGLLSREVSSQTSLEIGRAILKCHMELSKGVNWRVQTELLHQLEHLTNCLTSDFIHQHFTSVIFAMLGDQKSKPVKAQAARLLLVFLRYNIKEIQRKWIRENLLSRLYASPSCYTRHIFIKMCESAMDIFSKKYFKEYFFHPLVDLLDDKVSNIRLCVIKLLPKMKAMLTPEDKALHQLFEKAVKKIRLTEKNRDVIYYFKMASKFVESGDSGDPEDIAEEKLRQEDEAKIAQGKIVENTRLLEGLFVESKHPAFEPKPLTTPSGFGSQSKFTFLEQHFYIDAGITLPIKNIPPPILTEECNHLTSFKDKLLSTAIQDTTQPICDDITSLNLTLSFENIDLTKMTRNELKNLESSTTNITDDVKVNLKKITETEIQHEEETKKKLLNRRSLSNLSKIPVSLKNSKINENNFKKNKPLIEKPTEPTYSKSTFKVSSSTSQIKSRPKSEIFTSSNTNHLNLKSQRPLSSNRIINKRASLGCLSQIKTEIPVLKINKSRISIKTPKLTKSNE